MDKARLSSDGKERREGGNEAHEHEGGRERIGDCGVKSVPAEPKSPLSDLALTLRGLNSPHLTFTETFTPLHFMVK